MIFVISLWWSDLMDIPRIVWFVQLRSAGALESAMCDFIKISLKRRIATRTGKENQPLSIKTAVERPILKQVLQNFRWNFYFILLVVASLLYRRVFLWRHTWHFPALWSAAKTNIFFLKNDEGCQMGKK